MATTAVPAAIRPRRNAPLRFEIRGMCKVSEFRRRCMKGSFTMGFRPTRSSGQVRVILWHLTQDDRNCTAAIGSKASTQSPRTQPPLAGDGIRELKAAYTVNWQGSAEKVPVLGSVSAPTGIPLEPGAFSGEEQRMDSLLESIHSPADLKRLNYAQMATLAEEIRAFLIQTLSKTGGHLGPNLGVVELTLALHAVFNTPKDRILFDVSHQAYIHKIITGRLDRLETIRQPGGLNGFMLRSESEHDCYGAGHAGTALSAALGMAVARDIAGGSEHVIAVAGDAAFTNGISFEALNNIAEQSKRLIVVLNDNEWSIDRNVGAVAR